MAANTIKFVQLTQAKYNTLVTNETADTNTLYFTTDTHRLYKGDKFYSNNISVATTDTTASNAFDSVLYINSATGHMQVKVGQEMVDVVAKALESAYSYTASTATQIRSEMSAMSTSLSTKHASDVAELRSEMSNSISALGDVFELKGYINSNDHTESPLTATITGLEKGDVYLVDQKDSNNGNIITVEYVCVNPEATGAARFERFGSSTGDGATASKNYVDTKFAETSAYADTKYSENSQSISTLRADSSAYAESLFSINSASIQSLNADSSAYTDYRYSQNSQSLSTFMNDLKVTGAEDQVATFKDDGYVQNSGMTIGGDALDNDDANRATKLATEKAVYDYTTEQFSQLSAYVDASIVWQTL